MSANPLDAYRRAAAAASNSPAAAGHSPSDASGAYTAGANQAETSGRPWIGVQFTCAAKYVRVFRRGDGAGYLARCPACGKSMWFRVGEGGTGDRFFELSCR